MCSFWLNSCIVLVKIAYQLWTMKTCLKELCTSEINLAQKQSSFKLCLIVWTALYFKENWLADVFQTLFLQFTLLPSTTFKNTLYIITVDACKTFYHHCTAPWQSRPFITLVIIVNWTIKWDFVNVGCRLYERIFEDWRIVYPIKLWCMCKYANGTYLLYIRINVIYIIRKYIHSITSPEYFAARRPPSWFLAYQTPT